MKKFIILFSLFVLPLAAYLFIIQGELHYKNLPVLTENVESIDSLDSSKEGTSFKNKISVLCFLGSKIDNVKGGILNLNEIVYKKLVKYKEFQIVVIVPEGNEGSVVKLKNDLTFMVGTDLDKWKFVYANEDRINSVFNSLKTPYKLDGFLSTSMVFIVDKQGNLRGRSDDEDSQDGNLFGFDMNSAASLKNKLLDDVKVVFYEYNSALKENRSNREI